MNKTVSDKGLFAHLFVDLHGAQNYKDVTVDELIAGSRYYQRKYDGNWGAAISTTDGLVSIYSKTGKCKHVTAFPLFPKTTIVIGEYLVGTQWSLARDHGSFYVFDCVLFNGKAISGEPWIQRAQTANFIARQAGGIFKQTEVFTADTVHPILYDKSFEGIVGRRENELWQDSVMRYKHTYTADVRIVGFEPGTSPGKYAHTLGALKVQYQNGAVGTCSGMDDAQRDWFWKNQDKALGLCVELEGKAVFESGLLRHPQFKRVRTDK